MGLAATSDRHLATPQHFVFLMKKLDSIRLHLVFFHCLRLASRVHSLLSYERRREPTQVDTKTVSSSKTNLMLKNVVCSRMFVSFVVISRRACWMTNVRANDCVLQHAFLVVGDLQKKRTGEVRHTQH